MGYEESAQKVSVVAGATFSTGDYGKGCVLNSNGHVVLPNTTGNVLPFGVILEATASTSSTGSQAIAIGVGGVVPVRMAASTIAAGGFVGFSTAGLGQAPSSDAYTFGIVKSGSSGAVNRILPVLVARGPLDTP